jgi:hypothetical protein
MEPMISPGFKLVPVIHARSVQEERARYLA